MTPDTGARLTIDDVRHHAEEVRDLALSEAKRLADDQASKALLIGAVVVIGVVSLAYFLGTRSGRRGYGL